MSSPHLPNHLYSASLIGWCALETVLAGSPLDQTSDMRAGFLVDQIETAATLPHSVYQAATILTISASRHYQYIRHLAVVPSFCYVKLFKPEWVVPALCALGPYPLNIDVVALKKYFRAEGKVIARSGTRMGTRIVHVIGT